MKRHRSRPFRHGRADQFGLGAQGRCWRRHSGLAIASHCTGFRSAARTSVPARLGGARSSMRTFRPAAPGSTSRTQPARNPCRAHNDVRGDRPVRQPRRRPGQHETGQHIGLQRRQLLRRHRRPRHPQISYGCQAQTRACSPSPSQQNERSGRYTFRNPEFTSDGRTRIDRARRPRYWVYIGRQGQAGPVGPVEQPDHFWQAGHGGTIRGKSAGGGGNATPSGQIMPCAGLGPARLVVTHRGRDWRLPGRCVAPGVGRGGHPTEVTS